MLCGRSNNAANNRVTDSQAAKPPDSIEGLIWGCGVRVDN